MSDITVAYTTSVSLGSPNINIREAADLIRNPVRIPPVIIQSFHVKINNDLVTSNNDLVVIK